jgi:squalene synthase HpnC
MQVFMSKLSAQDADIQAMPVTHPENFPVASWLCPPALRPAIAAIYAFARAADDIADEGDQTAEERLLQLQAFRQALIQSPSAGSFHPEIFEPLHRVIIQFQLPVVLLDDLLKAFEQDVVASEQATTYDSTEALLQYCRYSANPVGRLLLHLYGVQEAAALQESDAVCSALQLINFWQDLSEDIPRGRYYLPQDLAQSQAQNLLIETLCQQAGQLMASGKPLVHKIPGRAGWELRLVIQGGLRVLEKVQKLGPQAFHHRPTLRAWDIPVMFWRCLWM